MTAGEEVPFWERPETVARFADRDPDVRLGRLLGEFATPASTTVLDLGCAGGRNAVLLARRGFDFHARDNSSAMIRETRSRVAEILGPEEAARRVRTGAMDDLADFQDGSVDLVVALGVFHNAGSRREWSRALRETARALKQGGLLLVANHTDETDLDGTGSVPAGDEPDVYLRRSGRSYLLSATRLDEEMGRHGLLPVCATETVRRVTDSGGRRVTANGLYRKAEADPARSP